MTPRGPKPTMILIEGRWQTAGQWARELGVPLRTFRRRLVQYGPNLERLRAGPSPDDVRAMKRRAGAKSAEAALTRLRPRDAEAARAHVLQSDLGPVATRVAIAMIGSQARDGWCSLSVRGLARAVAAGTTAVEDALAELRQRGWMETEQSHGNRVRRRLILTTP